MIYEFKYKKSFKIKNGKIWVENGYLFIKLDSLVKVSLNEIEQMLIVHKSGFLNFITTELNLYHSRDSYICIKFEYIEDKNDIELSDLGIIFKMIRDNIANPNIVQVPVHKGGEDKYWLIDKERYNNLFIFLNSNYKKKP